MESVIEVLRYVALCQLLFLSFFLWCHGSGSLSARLLAVFNLSIACYLLCPEVHKIEEYRLFFLPVFAGCFGVAFFFWITSASLFDDSFRLGRRHWLALAGLEALSFFLFFADIDREATDSAGRLVSFIPRLFPQLISLGFIILALVQVQGGKQADLLEGRRRFRSVFIPGAGAYIVIVLAVELMIKRERPALLLELINLCLILGMVYLFSYKLLRLRKELLPDFLPAARPAGSTASGSDSVLPAKQIPSEELEHV